MNDNSSSLGDLQNDASQSNNVKPINAMDTYNSHLVSASAENLNPMNSYQQGLSTFLLRTYLLLTALI